MGITNSIKTILESVGKNNKPIYAVVAVAAANGIFKPLTSLTDKNEKPETKKYAALREFFTELTAIPTYIACYKIAEKSAEKLYKNNPAKLNVAKANLGFVGVCVAAIFVIPAACSLLVKPFTNLIYKNKKNNAQNDTVITPVQPKVATFSANYHKYSMATFTNRGGLKI